MRNHVLMKTIRALRVIIYLHNIADWGRMGGIGSDGTVRACLNEVNKNLVNDSNYDRVANACGTFTTIYQIELEYLPKQNNKRRERKNRVL
jgi:hypothetical protein